MDDRASNIRRIKEEAKRPKEKKIYHIPKISRKKVEQSLLDSEDKDKLWEWFLDRRKEMTGKCLHCGDKSEKENDRYFHFSIAHILPKKLFPSVETHPLNWIELCHFGNSCHTNLDNYFIDLTDLNCWDTVVERFVAIYPSIDKAERKNIPETLRQYITVDL